MNTHESTKSPLRGELRFLRFYALAMSLFAAVFLIGAVENRSASFDTIDARLINVRDADGTLRLALFGKDREPPDIIGGKSYSGRAGGPNADAGLMFYNDERDEIGGLIFGLHKTSSGQPEQGQSLTFDAYRQDQAVQLLHDQAGDDVTSGLFVNDLPRVSLATTIPMFLRARHLPVKARDAAIARMRANGLASHPRFFAGVDAKSATISLRDALGRTRLRLSVAPDGTQKIEFLDASGKVRRTI